MTKKHHTFSSTAGARPTIPTILGMVIEDDRTIFAHPNFFDPISIFAAIGLVKICGKMPSPREYNYNLVDCPLKVTKLKT